MSAIGALLINVGSPQSYHPRDVRAYLREFLSDPLILDMPAWQRFLLLNVIILPKRSQTSAELYQSIWSSEGSPLLVNSQKLAQQVQQSLNQANKGKYLVRLAMRYGQPSIASQVEELCEAGVSRIKVIPLYPQYAASTTASAANEVYRVLGSRWNMPAIEVVPPFFGNWGYLQAFAERCKAATERSAVDLLLFSFHGLPVRHLEKGKVGRSPCSPGEEGSCCQQLNDSNQWCYRAQCFETARSIAKLLELEDQQWMVSFQSRLGSEQWIGPHTDAVLAELAREGKRRVAVCCPAFVADCLETIEEIGVRGKEVFLACGGQEFTLVPSLNDHPLFVRTVCRFIEGSFLGQLFPYASRKDDSF